MGETRCELSFTNRVTSPMGLNFITTDLWALLRLEQMHFQVKVFLACLISFIYTQQGYCDEVSAIKNWTCECLYSHQEYQSHTIESNCSTSCNCNQDAGSGNIWTCICSADGLPKVAANDRNANCFRACNCTFGSLGEAHSSKKHISRKSVVIILLMGVILTTFAFVASVTCYFYRKEKYRIQSQVFSSDRETSFNSATNLINHRTYSQSETKMDTDSSIEHITGCFYRSSCLFGSNMETRHGTITQFAFSELQKATGKFSNSNLIGNGASSYVYRGELKDGRIVAVKRLNSQKGSDAEFVFLTEIELLSRLHHCHVVPMVGYCSESHRKHTERLLVYEYQPNGNLRECLDGALGKKMGWGIRVAIAIGAARGLEYLHEAAAPKILHRDIKSSNILLDENWQAKITDLGMAKNFKTDGFSSCSNSPARMQGTFGYFAPEYAIVGRASLKSDVFSFGVVLLELITGRHPIHKSSAKGEESLVIWATPRLLDSKRVITELADPRLDGKFPEQEMHIMAYLAKECLQLDPDDRPTMSEVVQILSAIAPERSRRRNILRSSSFCMKTEQYKDKHDLNHNLGRVEISIDSEKLRHVESCKLYQYSHRQDDYSTVENAKENACAAESTDRLILLTSKPRSSHALDDETVDLMEPRFESFCMDNVSPDKLPNMDKGLRQAR